MLKIVNASHQRKKSNFLKNAPLWRWTAKQLQEKCELRNLPNLDKQQSSSFPSKCWWTSHSWAMCRTFISKDISSMETTESVEWMQYRKPYKKMWKLLQKIKLTNLANRFLCRGLPSPSGARGQSGGGFHDWCWHLRLHRCGCGLSCHGGRHFTNKSHISFYHDVGIIFCCHIQNFQAIVVKTRELALERMAPFLASNFYGCLAIEDCELTPCEDNIIYMQKCWLWKQHSTRMITDFHGVNNDSNKL